jgi:serine/threonine protein phosphatase PrpC
MSWRFEQASAIGGRAEQQDRVGVLTLRKHPDVYLVVLADGMGGQKKGALAAQIILDTAQQAFTSEAVDDPKAFLEGLCHRAHEAIREAGLQHGCHPASTCTFLYLDDREAYWVHVGDSRLYHFNDGKLLSHTRDHSVGELAGSEGGAAEPDGRLYMCLGGKNELDPAFDATAIADKDWFMVCSDGFWKQVDPEEVALAMQLPDEQRMSARDLAALAERRAGEQGDNVSLVLAVREPSPPKSLWRRLLPGFSG